LNEVTTIVPASFGAPGSQIALAGWGLETTRAVKFNDIEADFTVVHGGHVNVTVPDIPPGTYVVHAVLAPTVGRASFWEGFSVRPSTSSTSEVAPSTPVDLSMPATPKIEPEQSATLLAFKGKRTKLNKATRRALSAVAAQFNEAEDSVVILAYSSPKGTKASDRRAKKRASKIRKYLTRIGFVGDATIRVARADSLGQSREVIIYAADAATTREVDSSEIALLVTRPPKGRKSANPGLLRR
jgi:outer membrane protein OmpA-like peptidoglycan-associated protein